MDKRMLTIILAVVLIASFFLPIASHESGSAFDMVKSSYTPEGFEGVLMKYVWIVFPLAGLMLLVGALNNGNYFLGRALWVVLPLLAILYIIIRPLTLGAHIDIMTYIKSFGVGLWLALVGSLVLVIYNPRR